jgi:hypothetical protein
MLTTRRTAPNPYGTIEAYAHPYPARFFDFENEVKLGAEFWNFVGAMTVPMTCSLTSIASSARSTPNR